MIKKARKKKRHPEAVYFTDVSIVRNDHVLFTAHYYALEDTSEEKTALISMKNGQWGGTNLQGIAHALRIDHKNDSKRLIYVLERNRGVYKLNPSIKGDWTNIAEDRQGFLMDLNKIDENWYSVGGNYQVYKEQKGKWTAIDHEIYTTGEEGATKIFTTIDGASKKDIYVAGMNGVIYHYDGSLWKLLDTPTNIGIQKILCLSSEQIYACGYANLLMKGNRHGWVLLTEPDEAVKYWDMILFKGDIYLCSSEKLFKLTSDDQIIEVDINVEGPVRFYRMDCNNKQLWTVGDECILKFDGDNWEQFKFPLNEV